MNKTKVVGLVKQAEMEMIKRSPEILTSIGIVGMLTTTILAVRATPKALDLLDQELDYRTYEGDKPGKLTKLEVIKIAWKCYIPAAISGGVSTACIIGAASTNARRNAALVAAFNLSETALKEYQSKVVETIGEKKEQAVHDAIAKDAVEKHPVDSGQVFMTDKGNTLCYDKITDRYFRCNMDNIKKAVNEINFRLRSEMYISLNEFYQEIGWKTAGVGDDLGWNIETGGIELYLSTQLSDNDEPCIVLDYSVRPRWDYATLH